MGNGEYGQGKWRLLAVAVCELVDQVEGWKSQDADGQLEAPAQPSGDARVPLLWAAERNSEEHDKH